MNTEPLREYQNYLRRLIKKQRHVNVAGPPATAVPAGSNGVWLIGRTAKMAG